MGKRKDLTQGSVLKNVWVLALPMMFSGIIQTAFNIVDMFWVGRLGSEAIAAVAMSGAVIMIVVIFVMGLGRGTSAMVARFIGAKQVEEANRVAMQSIFLALVISFLLAIVGYLITPFLFNLLAAGPGVISLGTGYMRIIFLGGISMVFLFLISSIFQGAGDAVTPMKLIIIAALLNAVLDPLLIFGISFFPKMGVSGAALATVCSQGFGALIGIYLLAKGRSLIHVNMRMLKFDFSMIRRVLIIGIPASLQMGLRSFMAVVLMGIVARYGTYAVAAYGIGVRLQMMVLMPGFSLGNAAGTLVGQNLGAGKPERAEKSGWSATGIYMIIMLIVGVLSFIFAAPIIKIFSKELQVIAIGEEFLKITAVMYVFTAMGLVLSRALMGAGDTVSPVFLNLFALWGLQVPLAIMIPRITGAGVTGVFWAIVIASVINGITTAVWFKIGRWKHKRI
ncbi:MAG: MATE family efflux transporter [bacterium]